MRRAKPGAHRASVARVGAPLDLAAAAAVEGWTSKKPLSVEDLAFCRRAVRAISPPTAHAARVYLTALANLVAWCTAEHVPVDEDHVSGEMPMPQWRSSARHEAPVGASRS